MASGVPQAHLEQSLETAHKRIDKKAESKAKGHGTRLEPRQYKLVTLEQELQDAKGKYAKLSEQAATLGPAG